MAVLATLGIGVASAPAAEMAARMASGMAGRAAETSAELKFFEAKIRPVLVVQCYSCHSAESGKSEGGLRLDSRAALLAGGDRGPAVVPNDPAASLLLSAITHADGDLQMPPKKQKLPDAVAADFRKWIEMGAPDPRDEAPAPARPPVDIETGRQFWAYRRPAPPQLPATSNPAWARRDLDHFILAALDEAGLTPSPDAAPARLLRRLHFDLIGLPPTPSALRRFKLRIDADGLDVALAEEVDRLLAQPEFGERWGRHWLDVARFAESSGKEANISFPHAWRYRDYVIDCFAADMPFDRFLLEQIAGDLLPCDDDAERARLLIATGFLAIGPKNLDEGNELQFRADLIDEQIDSVTQAVMASSVACARCHDHKFEPFSMQDYYALAGVFGSTKTFFGTAVSPANRVGGDPLPLPRLPDEKIFDRSISAAEVAKLKKELFDLKFEAAEGQFAMVKAFLTGEKPEKEFTLTDALRIFWRSGAIEGQLEKVDHQGQALPLAMGVLDEPEIRDLPLLERGEVARPGPTVPRAFPRVIELADTPAIPSHQSGRLELAQWLTHPDHPLTARVMANRAWRWLFGAGLVRTVDNFGFSGERPSHPELLDHLATRFVAEGWSVKRLVREMVLSRTYRQASSFREEAFAVDPDNRLLWRASKRRLDAEAIRDAMLSVSGELDHKRPGASLVATHIGDKPISLIGLDTRIPADLDGAVYRSVYLPVLRDRLPDVLDLFDFAEPSLVTGNRETTNVPVQALYLMNGPFTQARAEALAQRLRGETDDQRRQIRRAFLLCFARLPDAEELRLAETFFARGLARAGDDASQRQQVLASYCQALLATAEFRNLD